jgi:hypothetical protein
MSFMGGACRAPTSGEGDPRCPNIGATGLGMIPSCCTEHGECGIDATQFGMSCISLQEAIAGAMSMGTDVDLPAPRRCDAEDADDAGADAGDDGDAGM